MHTSFPSPHPRHMIYIVSHRSPKTSKDVVAAINAHTTMRTEPEPVVRNPMKHESDQLPPSSSPLLSWHTILILMLHHASPFPHLEADLVATWISFLLIVGGAWRRQRAEPGCVCAFQPTLGSLRRGERPSTPPASMTMNHRTPPKSGRVHLPTSRPCSDPRSRGRPPRVP